MKTRITLLLIAFLFSVPFMVNSQTEDNSKISLEKFDALIVGGYYKINLHYSDNNYMVIHANDAIKEKIITEVQNEVLQISNRPIRSDKAIKIDLYSNYISDFDVSGAVIIRSDDVQKPETINLEVSGAADVKLSLETKDVRGKLSGAAMLELDGQAEEVEVYAKGASIIRIGNLKSSKSNVVVTGSAGVAIPTEATESDFAEIAEDEEADYDNEIRATDKDGEKTTYGVTYDGSTARAKFLGIRVNVDEDEESGEVRIGTHKWVYDGDGEVTHKRLKRKEFNGHWGGVGLGINGYVNDEYGFDLPEEYEFMDLLWQKSINVDLNIYEQNISLSNNGRFGMITGIGYSIHNYRFNKSFTIMQDSSSFSGLINDGITVSKSKIVTNYITVPVLFEIQDINPNPTTRNRWHVNVGAIFGLRVHTHQKTVFEEASKEYNLVNPITNNIDATATSPSDPVSKVHDSFYMNPFKVDASLRIGWGWVNLYGNVSLTEMFNKDKGPKLYPFTVGIMVVGW